MSELIQQFRVALQARGIVPPTDLIPDGKLHRCDADGKHGHNDAAYVLHLDGVPAGGFENWRDGQGWQNWQADSDHVLTPAAQAEHRAKIEAAQRAKAAEDTRAKAEARERAAGILAESTPCTAHPYLTRKGIKPHGARVSRESLVLPVRDSTGVLHSLQFISADGGKKFLWGGRITGCYFSIGKPDGLLCICEGFATAASIHESTGYAVVAAFSAGNLLAVTKSMRTKYPDCKLIVCADDDANSVGISKAREAANAVGGFVVLPDFGADRPADVTDFNDLSQHGGADAVHQQIEAALSGPAIPQSTDDVIARLAKLPPMEYEKARECEASRLGVRVSVLDAEVAKSRTSQDHHETGAMFNAVEPWPEPANGEALLNELVTVTHRFIICSRETAIAVALWCAFTWLITRVQVSPLAIITAPEKRCGKSQLLNLMGRLVLRPLVASNISPSAVFRVIEAHAPTLLIDEADTFMRDNEELRGVINSGHTRQAAYVVRCVGDDHEPVQFSTWGAKALSGIGHLPETIRDRGIILELRRKLPSESVGRLRHAEAGLFDRLASQLARFAADAGTEIERARPSLPDELNDRAQDNWEPLLAIADAAGGEWPKLARHAALKLSGAEQDAISLSAEMLADIREAFDLKAVSRLSTAELLQALIEDDVKPWATYNRGKPMAPRQLAKRLDEYGIQSRTIRMSYGTAKGFHRDQFDDAFARYLSPATPLESVTAAQPYKTSGFDVTDGFSYPSQEAPNPSHVTTQADSRACDVVTDNTICDGTQNTAVTQKDRENRLCDVVTDMTPPAHEVVL